MGTRGFEAAKILLEAETFTGRFDPFIRAEGGPEFGQSGQAGVILWDGIREEGPKLSTGERILVDIAWQLWSGHSTPLLESADRSATLADAQEYFDRPCMERLIAAIEIRAGMLEPEEAQL